jgi:hypothetical protein
MSVIWNGKRYPSVTAAATACGITPAAMRYRLRQGYTCDDDMTPRGVIWNGKRYPSLAAAARANHITLEGMRYRVRVRGYTCDDDLRK